MLTYGPGKVAKLNNIQKDDTNADNAHSLNMR